MSIPVQYVGNSKVSALKRCCLVEIHSYHVPGWSKEREKESMSQAGDALEIRDYWQDIFLGIFIGYLETFF